MPERSRSPGRAPPEAESRGLDANRKASAPFTQRSRVETAKTATKRTAFVANDRPEDADIADRREPRPIDHDAADAPSTNEATTMTAIGTPMRLQGMLPPQFAESNAGDCQPPPIWQGGGIACARPTRPSPLVELPAMQSQTRTPLRRAPSAARPAIHPKGEPAPGEEQITRSRLREVRWPPRTPTTRWSTNWSCHRRDFRCTFSAVRLATDHQRNRDEFPDEISWIRTDVNAAAEEATENIGTVTEFLDKVAEKLPDLIEKSRRLRRPVAGCSCRRD